VASAGLRRLLLAEPLCRITAPQLLRRNYCATFEARDDRTRPVFLYS
jgi:hypothetical protein